MSDGPVHVFFGLTYSNYLVVPRSVLQSMPEEWQAQFVGLLEDMQDTVQQHDVPVADHYQVKAAHFVAGEEQVLEVDPTPPYNRGRTRLWENANVV